MMRYTQARKAIEAVSEQVRAYKEKPSHRAREKLRSELTRLDSEIPASDSDMDPGLRQSLQSSLEDLWDAYESATAPAAAGAAN
jgi:hypothetical protein